MNTFDFNKIFVLESLFGERQTGKELYQDILRWQKFKHKGKLQIEFIEITNKSEFNLFFEALTHECRTEGIMPILHLEIHGNSYGLQLVSKEIVSWEELYNYLVAINIIIKNNLFLTLGVCEGAYLMSQIKPYKPVPFYGFIGSFQKITSEDIIIRYSAFYTEFLESFSVNKAINMLFKSNPKLPSSYQLIKSEETFYHSLKLYEDLWSTPKKIDERFENLVVRENLVFVSRQERRKNKRWFEKQLKGTKEQFRLKYMRTFFMVDKYPDQIERFDLPQSIKDEIKIVTSELF